MGMFIVLLCTAAQPAYAVTAAEKQQEADAIMSQIDSLQTSLNEANAEYNQAVSDYNDAIAKRDEAERQIEEETAHLEDLQYKLNDYARYMYKTGGDSSYLEVLLGTSTFEDFLTSWDVITTISNRGSEMVIESKEARATYEEARATYQEQSDRAATEMATAEAKSKQIEETQQALRDEAAKITAEVAALQAEEEAQAEAAQQAAAAAEAYESGSYSAGESVLSGSGYFTNPLPSGTLSSGFGYRSFDGAFHKGIDLAAAEGTPYYAADDGTVIYATYDGGYNGGAGNWIVIAHGNGIVTKYMHSSAVYVSVGEQVTRGQNIGAVGNTGNSFGAHLHFQVEIDGVAVNPLNYL